MNNKKVKVELKSVEKSFGTKKVLRGVDLKVCEGETLVVLGRSGSGKSVILKHIVGLMKPDRGKVYIDDYDITDCDKYDLYRIRRKIGMLFQSAALLDSLTVSENVGIALKEAGLSDLSVSNTVNEKLSLVGMEGTGNLMPADLSGGMKKRVGLARAIALEPEIVLYDEPTTGLDPIMADSIDHLIIELRKKLNVTSVAVTHDIVSAKKIGTRFAMLEEGKIIFNGSLEEFENTDIRQVHNFITGKADYNNGINSAVANLKSAGTEDER